MSTELSIAVSLLTILVFILIGVIASEMMRKAVGKIFDFIFFKILPGVFILIGVIGIIILGINLLRSNMAIFIQIIAGLLLTFGIISIITGIKKFIEFLEKQSFKRTKSILIALIILDICLFMVAYHLNPLFYYGVVIAFILTVFNILVIGGKNKD